jgi:hypothetical protein
MKDEKIQEFLDLCKLKRTELDKARAELKRAKKEEINVELKNEGEMEAIENLLKEKNDLITKALITIFKNNSVIIEGQLSIRQGQFRRFRRHYEVKLLEVKEKVYEYANFLKLTDSEKDVLDFCLKLVDCEDYDEYNGLRRIDDKWDSKELKLPQEICIYENCLDEDDDKEIDDGDRKVYSFRVIELSPKGDITFKKDEINGNDEINMSRDTEAILIAYLKDEINSLREKFNKEVKDVRERLEKEVVDIKDKCGKYLLIASLKEGND